MKTYIALSMMHGWPLVALWSLSLIGAIVGAITLKPSRRLVAGCVVALALAVLIVPKPLVPIDPYCFGLPDWLCYLLP
jgi:predicted membrane channel-forming protein YqfA (hemolysin III family)